MISVREHIARRDMLTGEAARAEAARVADLPEMHDITREIGIDAGHRVTFHGSKCRNVHGHRYTIQATCRGPLARAGEQQGMVLDFGFLKDEMMKEIDDPCDHGFIIWANDTLLNTFIPDDIDRRSVLELVGVKGYCRVGPEFSLIGKLYVVPFVPTAENLARHWFHRLQPRVVARSEGIARLSKVRVWETPNCYSDYLSPE